MNINLHHTELSRANGPGLRLVVWVQGCELNCKGCFNQPTHNPETGLSIPVSALAEQINALDSIDGVTISGGEPLDQALAIEALINAVHREKNWVLYTGYAPKEIFRDATMTRVVKAVDLTLAGRYHSNAIHPYQHKQLIKTSDRVDIDFFRTKRTVEFVVSSLSMTKTGLPIQQTSPDAVKRCPT
ncbi:4Fe-4S single cluster domain-containing protein [Pseudomonas batumici]|uniref:Ribonucleotide reductase of class III (Anaerobic), activating protein n=1 Tax=Pseudomonas batumici TaxID=226910 RepID=A0A0C2IDF0_9PSED|nr:4Fe-4S single cluster domain-containing protein [Pseudomonas batumici]KIH84980.1 Ribonucleotide reductase of class III (anaerobic), activating protein [Pseudomonas batumici]